MLCAELSLREQYLADRDLAQKRILEAAPDDAWLIADDWLLRWHEKLRRPAATESRPKFLQRYWLGVEAQAAAGSLLPWREA